MNEIVRKTGVVFGGKGWTVVCRLGALAIISRFLAPEDFGRLNFHLMIFVVFTQLVALGQQEIGAVFAARHLRGGRTMLGSLVGVGLATSGVSAAAYLLLWLLTRDVLFEGVTSLMVWSLALSIPAGQVFLLVKGICAGADRFRLQLVVTAVRWSGYVAFIGLCGLLGRVDLQTAWLGFILPTWLAALVGLGALYAGLGRGQEGAGFGSRQVVRFGLLSNLAQSVNLLQLRADAFLLRIFTSPEVVGYYSVATNLTEVILYLPLSLQTVLMARSAAPERRALDDLYAAGRQFLVTVLLAAAALAAFPFLIEVFFGAPYAPVADVARLLLVGTIFMGTGQVIGGFLIGRGRLGILVKVGLTALLASVVLDLIFIPPFGLYGAVVVSVVVYTAYALALVAAMGRMYGTPAGTFFRWRSPGAEIHAGRAGR